MTILGKVFVILNLILSLATGFLIVQVYVTRTNWRAGYDDLKKKYEVANFNSTLFQKEADDARTAAKAEADRLNTALQQAQTQLVQMQTRLQQQTGFTKEAQDRTSQHSVTATDAAAELDRRKQEVANLEKINKDREKQIGELEIKHKELRDKAVISEIQAEDLKRRNRRLMDQLEVLSKDLERAQNRSTAVAGTGAGSKTPPAEDVDGVVLEVDAKSGLVTVSLGSDQGVNLGNTLEVYRLEPRPEYLGMIKIVNADHHQAVGRAVQPLRGGSIQKGDRVASRITASRR